MRSDDGDGGERVPASLTRQLRELHLRLDPSAPRHLANGQRKSAIQQLLGGSNGDSGGKQGDGNGKAADDRGAKGGAGPRARAPRREAHGVSLPNVSKQKPPLAAQPPKRQPAARSGNSNADRIWRFLFGGS